MSAIARRTSAAVIFSEEIGAARVNLTVDSGISVASGKSWDILRTDSNCAIVFCATDTLPKGNTEDLGKHVLQRSNLKP